MGAKLPLTFSRYRNLKKFQFISNKAESLFRSYNYNHIIPNIVEHNEVFQRTLGETSEIITKVKISPSLWKKLFHF